MKFRALILAVGAAVTMAIPASAATQKSFKLVAAPQVYGPYSGEYVNPLNGPFDVFCTDFYNHVQLNVVYTVNISTLYNNNSLVGARFANQANALVNYRKAAWLSWQMTSGNQAQWSIIHTALWRLFSVPVTTGAPLASVNAWLTAADNWYNTTGYALNYWNSVEVLTDTRSFIYPAGQCDKYTYSCSLIDNDFQEFITTTPEPATMGLLAFGLVGLAGAGVVRLRRSTK